MSQINNISINIALKTLPLSQKGFGMPLIVGTTLPDNLDLIGAVNHSGGYAEDDETIVVDGFADSGNPIGEDDTFTIGGETGSPVHTVVSTTRTSNNTTSITFTPGLASAVADDAVVTVTKKTDDVYLEITDADELLEMGYVDSDPEYKMAGAIFSQSPRMSKVAVCYVPSFSVLATKLAELRNSGKDDWYWLLITSRAKADIAIADTYINTLEKVGVFGSSDQTITSTGERTVILISNSATDYPEAAWVGRCGAVPIGSISWDSKQLNGQVNSAVTTSQQSTLLANNFNLIREMGGVPVSWEGKTMSGQYIDNINGRDFLKARLTEAYQFLKINTNKVPMDLNGLAMIEAKLREVFRTAGQQGIIAPVISDADGENSDMGEYQYKLNMPADISDIPAPDRANRKVASITFSAKVGGGINKIEINGSLEV